MVGWLGVGGGQPSGTAIVALSVQVTRRTSDAPPQSTAEIAPIVTELRLLDPKLEVRWEPKAVLIAKGSYSELGVLIPPVYDGRWQVIRRQTENLHPTRGDYTVICTVSEYGRQDGILYFKHDGAYAPIDERLVELMRSADAQNVRQFTALRKKLWAQHDALEHQKDQIDRAEAEEGIMRGLHPIVQEGGRAEYQGQGADFVAPASSRIILP